MAGFIYAIGNDERVKIGYSADPIRRFSKLQTDSAVRCELIGMVAGTVEQERELHQLLAAYRIHREWFRREGVVAALCEMLPAPADLRKRAVSYGLFGMKLREVAAGCGVGISCASKWAKRGVPAHRVADVERVTGISRHVLRSDIFGAVQ